MYVESGVGPSIIHQLHSWDIQRDEIEFESVVTRSMIHELHSWDIQGDEMESENDVTRCMIDELYSLDIQGDQMEGERKLLLEVSSMNLIPILGMSKDIKWKVKVVLLEVSLMNFILGISKETNGR